MPSLHIHLPTLSLGGAERVAILLARSYQQAGYEVRFITRDAGVTGYTPLVKEEFELADLKINRVRKFPLGLYRFYRNSPHPDVVLTNLWPLTFLSTVVLRLSGIRCPIGAIEHGSLLHQFKRKGWLYQWLIKLSLKVTLALAQRVIGVSAGLTKELGELTGYKGPKLIHIPNPIEIENRREEAASILPFLPSAAEKTEEPILLFVGRLKAVKNIPLLLRAVRLVNEIRPVQLLIAGDGYQRDELEKLAEELGIASRVHFLGFQSYCGPLYQKADVFVLSSDSEGFGNVIVEALAEGCTVVSTDCPYGPREILDHGKYGYLCPVGDEEALSEAILRAINMPVEPNIAKDRALQYSPQEVFKAYQQALS